MSTNKAVYGVVRFVSSIAAKIIFNRKFIRNELKGQKGPIVLIGNHEAALDYTTLIGATKEHMTFVISDSFYNTLPIKNIMHKVGVIPKQQFQTTLREIAAMHNTVKNGGILMFYPAGLMTENGLPTPIPAATYKFLKKLSTDIYVAKVSGSYFCTPKWSSKMRRGRTYLDVFKLIDKNELKDMTTEQIRNKVSEALFFDAYREQETNMIKYKGGDNIEGLENVLYICPNCKEEFTLNIKNKNTIYCSKCGFAHTSDEYGFLHNSGGIGEEIRYVSDWSRFVEAKIKDDIENGRLTELSSHAAIQTIDYNRKKYVDVGHAEITLTPEIFIIDGVINGTAQRLEVPINNFASLPFKPGKRIEIQNGKTSYRCVLENGKLATKFVDMVKTYYEKNTAAKINSAE
ncbi:MAG: 1-acyl-sn-glycerol-3-phosphate acyltransferase [Clostridia bacterium]|nr:1-acyl-sn-glycerol-3-phosphate acyltransferase [Clostridia bacterium]